MLTASILLIAYSGVVLFLDWTRRIDTIEKRWPKAGKVLASRKVCILLLLVAVGLLVAVSGQKSPQIAAPAQPSIPTSTSGPATTSGPNSPANTGDGNTFTYGPSSQPISKRSDSAQKKAK